jgi:nitronate monooxygenase
MDFWSGSVWPAQWCRPGWGRCCRRGAGECGVRSGRVGNGGHLLGDEPLRDALPRMLSVADGAPVLAAGGVADAVDVRRLLDAGAAAAVAETRFLLTEKSAAHGEYKR